MRSLSSAKALLIGGAFLTLSACTGREVSDVYVIAPLSAGAEVPAGQSHSVSVSHVDVVGVNAKNPVTLTSALSRFCRSDEELTRDALALNEGLTVDGVPMIGTHGHGPNGGGFYHTVYTFKCPEPGKDAQ
ncbi:MAG: hypothetical protein MK180_17595 [Rhodobacteraceae bacterium]|nr:hypothetical protein [Paracoccaceae bacterium]